MQAFSADEIEAAQRTVYAATPPTPQYAWPLLRQRLGTEVWVKHENHTPLGAFKLRGSLVYIQGLAQREPNGRGVIDGMACRVADEEPLALIRRDVEGVVAVSDDEVAAAMRAMFSDTHNAAEGAGAASLAAAMQQRDRWRGQAIGVTLCGGNVDRALFARVLAEESRG